jgi:hypothetical protein
MFQKVKALVLTLLGVSVLPVAENKVSLSDDQKQLLKEAGGDDFLEKFIEAANKDLANAQALTDAKGELAQAKTQLKALLDSNGIDLLNTSEEEAEEAAETEEANAELQGLITKLQSKVAKLEGAVRTLASKPEADLPLIPNPAGKMNIVHSKTHLFGSTRSFDAFEGRNWNKRVAGMSVGATEWTGINIERINEDFGAYWREEREEVLTILRDYRGLPAHWGVISNVDDQITYAAMLTGEVTQARKKAWLPKNQNKFIPMKGQVYPVQIDLEWEGFELQKMETSWMNRWNKEGSQPYKMSFVRYLLVSILEKAREEDKIVLINGIHVPTPDDATKPANFIFRGTGLLKLIAQNRNKTYKAWDIGLPTTTNIVDYVKQFGERLPAEIKNAPGLHLYMSPSWIRKYYERRKIEDGLMPTYQPGLSTVEGFPNIMLTQLDYLEGSDLMFLTTRDNISLLQNIKAEESLLKVDMLKRNIYIYGDYKTGIMVHAFGIQWENGVALDDRNQLFWSNNVEILQNIYVPLQKGDATPSVKYHNFLQGPSDAMSGIIINDFRDAQVGQFITVRGGEGGQPISFHPIMTAFELSDGFFSLTPGSEIVFYVRALTGDGRFVEVYRRQAVDVQDGVTVPEEPTSLDAAQGSVFLIPTGAGASEITAITNAVDGTTYTLKGVGGTGAFNARITDGSLFRLTTADFEFANGRSIDLFYNGTQYIELSRVM